MSFEQHQVIWLQPWCNDCAIKSGEDRLWCQDDVWGKCEFCDAKPVKYVLAKRSKKPVMGRDGQ